MNLKEEDLTSPDHGFRSRKSEMRKQKSYWQGSTAKLSRFSNSVAVQGDPLLDMSGDSSANSQWPEDQFGMRCSHQADGDSKQLLDGLKSSQKNDFHPIGKDRAKVNQVLININLCNFTSILKPALHGPLREWEKD